MQRRDVLKLFGAGMLATQASAFAKPAKGVSKTSKKVVWVVLRGALDSLHWLPPVHQTEQLMSLRPNLYRSIRGDLLPLDGRFALHPSLVNVHKWYQQKQAIPVVATSSGYPKRSHFEAQDFLERGGDADTMDSGWLARLAQQLDTQSIAIARSTPISLRGREDNLTWYPSNLPDSEEGLFGRLMDMYQDSPLLAERLAQGMSLNQMADSMSSKQKGNFDQLAESCGNLMAGNPELQVAMLEMGGWDTHNAQHQRLNKRLAELDTGLGNLQKQLGRVWNDTLVIVATEFGRTVAENGTSGTDHGTASAMLLTGGAVNGGSVMGQWPGLKPEQLYKSRDLKATSNIYSWINTALSQHFSLSNEQLSIINPTADINSTPLINGQRGELTSKSRA